MFRSSRGLGVEGVILEASTDSYEIGTLAKGQNLDELWVFGLLEFFNIAVGSYADPDYNVSIGLA